MRIEAMLVVVLALAAGAYTAHAQQGQAGGPGPGMREGSAKQMTPEEFPDAKARVLKMLDERKARIAQERACVEKATSHEALKKCRPEPPMGGQMQRGAGQRRSMDRPMDRPMDRQMDQRPMGGQQ